MSLIRKHGAVLQAWACLDLVNVGVGLRLSLLVPFFSPEQWLPTGPATRLQQLQILGTTDPPLDILTTDPLQVIRSVPKTSRDMGRRTQQQQQQ